MTRPLSKESDSLRLHAWPGVLAVFSDVFSGSLLSIHLIKCPSVAWARLAGKRSPILAGGWDTRQNSARNKLLMGILFENRWVVADPATQREFDSISTTLYSWKGEFSAPSRESHFMHFLIRGSLWNKLNRQLKCQIQNAQKFGFMQRHKIGEKNHETFGMELNISLLWHWFRSIDLRPCHRHLTINWIDVEKRDHGLFA
jgi:hypothetical protein